MLRSALVIVATIALTILCGVPATLLSLVHRDGRWILTFGRIWARGICAAAGARVEARGMENVPKERAAILLANHQSNFDMLAILLSMPRPFRVVAKRFLFYIPVFGWCLRAGGMIPIDRDKRTRAIQSLEKVAARVRSGEPVLMFPEGTRSPDGALLPFKKGAFVIAVTSGVPVVPVSVTGGDRILAKHSLRVRPGRIIIRYGPEIPVTGHSLATKELLIAQVREAIEAGLAEIDPSRYRAAVAPAEPPAGAAGSGSRASLAANERS